MRYFTEFPPGKAIDLENSIQCSATGPEEIDPSVGMITEGYKLETRGQESRIFVVYETIYSKAHVLDGVKMIEDVIGHQQVTHVETMLKMKDFCAFAGSDFEFLRYLGSGVVASSSLLESHRVVALARDEDLRRAKIEIPHDVQQNQSGMIILADSKDAFVR